MQIDMPRIEALVDLMARSNVSEITVRNADGRITVRKARPGPAPARADQLVVHTEADASDNTQLESDSELMDVGPATPEIVTIIAPMVGIYRHAEPPIALGSLVAAGQVVGAIESMKLMNDVRAESAGRVTAVEVEAGMAVEYGQPLFALTVDGAGDGT